MDSKNKLFQSREIFPLGGLMLVALTARLIKISQSYMDEWSFKQGTIAMIA